MTDEKKPKKKAKPFITHKLPVGRPKGKTKYKEGIITEPEYEKSHPERLIELMSQGLFNYEIAAEWKINRDTLVEWRKAHIDLEKAYKIGECLRFRWWMTEGKKRFAEQSDKGYKFWVTIMNNMFSDMGWISEYGRNNATNTQINIQNMQVVQKDKTELLDSIKANFSQLWEHQKTELLESNPEMKELITYGSGKVKSDK